MLKPYYIIEVANVHGGDFHYLVELIDAFADLRDRCGIKFQAFHPDCIATDDYQWHKVYKELYFEKPKWKEAISRARETKDVWLDIFDTYGVDVLTDNLYAIRGIKFQSSVLHNYEVFNALNGVDLGNKKIILNVAAQPIADIEEIIARVEEALQPEEILLEFGYQAYPTSFEDSGLCKVDTIRRHFPHRIVFADHVDGSSQDAIQLPLVAAMNGVDVIEKHVMLDTRETKYDYFSSITPAQYGQMVTQLDRYTSIKNMPFISRKEKAYLRGTLMIPLLKHTKYAGTLFDVAGDFTYRRSGKTGLDVKEVEQLQHTAHILVSDKEPGETLHADDFKKATIATIIACRLKSSRLPQKALLPIGSLPSVELCLANALRFRNINHTILATSVDPQDAELENHTYKGSVIFHRGDPDDVVQRYLGIAQKLKVDIIIRVTADMPFIDNEICQILLQEHFKSGADYTVAREAAVGTNLEIINTQALMKVKAYFPSANYSEYMTWYFQNNAEHFRLHFVDLPKDLVRDYRLTLDYPEDLEMFNKLQDYFEENNLEFSLRKAYEYLDSHPELNLINSHLTLRYKTDQKLISTLNRVTKIRSLEVGEVGREQDTRHQTQDNEA
jgi:N,N'-diacetyllegionaminate synthase